MFIKLENKILNASHIESIIEHDGKIRIYMINGQIDEFFSFEEINIDEIYEMLKGA